MTAKVYTSPEQLEMDRRRPLALRELRGLVNHIKDLRLRANAADLPESLAAVEESHLVAGLVEAMTATPQPGVSPHVAKRMAVKLGEYFLWHRATTTPVIHELLVLAPWWIANMPGEVFAALRDIGLKYILNGRVLPVQTVWAELLAAPLVYMGHCTCRSSHLAEDLEDDRGEVYTIATPDQNALLLDRLMDRYRALRVAEGALPDTDARFADAFAAMDALRRAHSPDYRLATLLRRLYPFWEFLPTIDKYTPTWIRSLHRNHKAFRLHKLLAFELATTLYLSRGTMFSSMNLFDEPYCVCSCPTPENGGGCVLTNWYYAAGSEQSLLPSDDGPGRRHDERGNPLPCNQFPVRAGRPCVGCGCVHEAREPRGFTRVLRDADRTLASVGEKP